MYELIILIKMIYIVLNLRIYISFKKIEKYISVLLLIFYNNLRRKLRGKSH